MKVKVLAKVKALTDGRERFAGRAGEVVRPPHGRLVESGGGLEHVEAAYEVRFEDGDEAVFGADELEGEGLLRHVEAGGRPVVGAREAAAAGDAASVKKVSAKRARRVVKT